MAMSMVRAYKVSFCLLPEGLRRTGEAKVPPNHAHTALLLYGDMSAASENALS